MASSGGAVRAVAASVARQQLLSRFPGPFSFCFAYGSGVKQQLGYGGDVDAHSSSSQAAHAAKAARGAAAAATTATSSRSLVSSAPPMIDLIIGVDDAVSFHCRNIAQNPGDYAALMRLLGGRLCGRLQDTNAVGAAVFCNTLVPVAAATSACGDGQSRAATPPMLIKYSVVSSGAVVGDLLDWRHLYVAGRLHKPVEWLQRPQTDQLRAAIDRNLESVVRVALLRLPEEFGWYDLFHAVAQVSYGGDFRMVFGEKRDKVHNIVTPQLAAFRELYADVLRRMASDGELYVEDGANADTSRLVRNLSVAVIGRHLGALPLAVRERMGCEREADVALLSTMPPTELSRLVGRATERIVWHSSVGQSLKNIPTAGAAKAMRYSWQKVLKTFNM